ncbi:MAG: hypothetical protein KJO21_06400 [Verrucomicrobiae bacterium]|nr:hypothetical protein [Verrucomicrobiae bacterium]NNJ41767.1 hypothetical protein [Akkermansiaceae bacterium]
MQAQTIGHPPTLSRTNTFVSQLRFWSLHCGLTALPSFCIALIQFNSPQAVLAMLCGIATFVFGYAFLTSTSIYGKVHTGLIGRSIKLGTRIRMIISLASLPLLIPLVGQDAASLGNPPSSLFFVPDFWFGYAAIVLVFLGINAISRFGTNGTFSEDSFGQDFFTPYATTMLEGVLISISLVVIAFITLIILNFRRNRQQLPSQHIPQA